MYIKESDCDHLQLTINVIAANLILQEMQIRMQICKFLPSNNSSQHIMWGKRGFKHYRFDIIFFFNSIFLLRIFLYIFTSEMDFSIHPLVDVFFFQIFFIFKKFQKKVHPLVNVLENTSHHEDV